MATYSVVAPDGQFYGPVDESALGQWVREGRVNSQTVLHCHDTNARVSAASVPALQPLMGLSPPQVSQILQPPPHQPPPGGYGAPDAAPYGQPGAAAPLGYGRPAGYGPTLNYGGRPAHQLTEFSTAGAVVLSIFVPLFALIYYGLAHGNLPKRRHDDPGAGKAIGFMFIPFFNIYWMCFFWIRLCTRINDEQMRAGLPPTAPRGLVIAMCWTYLGMLIPIVNILAMLALLVMGILTLSQLQSSINALVRATRGVRY